MSSICDDEPGRFGVQGGHERKTLTLSVRDAQPLAHGIDAALQPLGHRVISGIKRLPLRFHLA